MVTGRKSRRHLLKPLRHVGVVLLVAILVVIGYKLGFVSKETQVPRGASWFIDKIISTNGFILTALIVILVALLHKRFEQQFHIRGGIRKFFFLVLAFLVGKFYTWSGLLLGMWVLANFTDIAPQSPLYLVYALASLIIGFLVWVTARLVAFRGMRSLPPSANQSL